MTREAIRYFIAKCLARAYIERNKMAAFKKDYERLGLTNSFIYARLCLNYEIQNLKITILKEIRNIFDF